MEKKYMDELKSALEKKKVVIGARETMKLLKTGKLELIIISTNCPEETKKDLEHYKKSTELDIQEFGDTSKQLGIFCGKPFQISVIGVK